MKICPGCGTSNADDARFCEGCGKALEDNNSVPKVEAEVVSGGGAYSGGGSANSGAFGYSNSQGNNGFGYGNANTQNTNATGYADTQNSSSSGYGYSQNTNTTGYSTGQNTAYGQGYSQPNYNQQGYSQQNYSQQNYGQPGYNYQNYAQPQKSDLTTVCTLSLIFGIVSFLCDPLYLLTTAAFVLGIIGLINNGSKKNLALAGLICSVVACGFQIIVDICTLGIGVFF